MIKKETDRQNYSILAGEGAILRILKEIDKANNRESIGAGIQKLLEVLGNYGNADRAYLFETVHTPETFTNTYEWCADGITAQRDNLQDVKFEEIPCWVKKFRQGESVVVNNIEDICHTMPLEYELLKMKAIKSVVVLPLFHGSYLTGFLGLDNPYIQENENFIFFLELIGAHLDSALVNTLVEQDLKQKTKELEHKNMFLDTLCQEYTSVYYVDLDAGFGEVIKVDSGANFIKASNKTMIAYMPMLKAYAESYVIEEDRDYFLARLETYALKEELLKEERVSFRYRSLPNNKTHKNFEVHAIRANGTDQNSFGIMVAFRYVDDIIKQEQKIQKTLEKTLEESRISNSIVSAIGKIYFSLYRIVLENDQYGEISAEQEIHRLTGKVGLASEKMKEICDNFVCQEHYDMVLKFFDLSTLADRLKNDDTIDNYYTNVGCSYYSSREFSELMVSFKSSFTPISRFGIGILSCFMVCDSMEVTTRRIRERFECDEALHISIEGYESLFVISDSNKKEPGTDTILTLRPVHPWDRMNEEEFMQCIKGIVPNPAVQIEIETNKGSELYSSDYFDDLDLKPLLDYSWNNIKNIRKIDIDLTCEEYGFKGKGCIGILIKNGLPAEEIEILSKDVEIDGEIYTLSSNIKYKTNCITETSTSISVDEDGEIDTNTSWSERFKSKASLSIHGIEVPYNLFPDYSNRMSKAVLKIPFPFSFRLDIGVNSDLNLNSARDQIIYDEKWLTFEENLYRIICRRLKDALSSSDWKILNEIIQKNNTDTFSRVANSFE